MAVLRCVHLFLHTEIQSYYYFFEVDFKLIEDERIIILVNSFYPKFFNLLIRLLMSGRIDFSSQVQELWSGGVKPWGWLLSRIGKEPPWGEKKGDEVTAPGRS